MSLLSRQLSIKRFQKELKLSNRDFNKLNLKHKNNNLIKQLQILNPVASGPPSTAPYSLITTNNPNITLNSSTTLYYQFTNGTATLNGNPAPNGQTIINGGFLNVSPPVGSNTYTLFVTNSSSGATATSSVTINVTAPPPPPPANTGWYGEFIIYNGYGGTQSITMTVDADTNGTIVGLHAPRTLQPDEFYVISVSQQNRLTSPSTLIKVTYTVAGGGIIATNYFSGLTLTNSSSSIYNLTVDSGFINGQNIDWELVTEPLPPPVAPSITYTGNYTNDFPYIMSVNGGLGMHAYNNRAFPFNLTFPAGTTRVRLTSPVNFIVSIVDFVPTTTQTSALVSINKINPGQYYSEFYIKLVLNNEVGYSAQYFIAVYEE